MKKILLNKFFYIPAAIVIVVVAYFSLRDTSPQYEYVAVSRGTVVSEVSITGSVKPIESVLLSFEKGGRIASVPVAVGSSVAAGQVLLSLDVTADVLDLREAEAGLVADEAFLLQLKKGTRPEDIAVLESKEGSAKTALSDAQKSLVDKLKDAYTKTDDAVGNYGDQFFDNPHSSSPAINIMVNDSQLKTDINYGRLQVGGIVASWQTSLASLTESSDLSLAASIARTNLTVSVSFFDTLSLAVNALTPSQSLSQTSITTYRSNVSTARAAVNTALSNVSTGEDGYNTALSNLDLARKNLQVGRAGSVPEEIQAAEAKVLGDKAQIAGIQHSISLSSIRSPFAGVVTRQDGKKGEAVSANNSLVSVIGASGFQIEANVPEADIAKLSLGQSASVTLDAYGSDVFFNATVAKIDPAETLIDNVATYKITLGFLEKDERVRSGMTANIDVLSAKKENVLVVPARAVIDKDGVKTVRVAGADGAVSERSIETGLKGSDGQIEILSGLSESERIVVGNK